MVEEEFTSDNKKTKRRLLICVNIFEKIYPLLNLQIDNSSLAMPLNGRTLVPSQQLVVKMKYGHDNVVGSSVQI